MLWTDWFFVEALKDKFKTAASLALYHHRPEENVDNEKRRLQKIVCLSDWLSSGERRDDDSKTDSDLEGWKSTLLQSVFTTLHDENGVSANQRNLEYWPLSILSFGHPILPLPKMNQMNLTNDLPAIWNELIGEAKEIDGNGEFNIFIESLLSLLEKYTLFIPSSAHNKDRHDISLYHHLKTTAAIAACLYDMEFELDYLEKLTNAIKGQGEKNLLEEKLCFLIGGDISGIQDFIYGVRTEKALKGLRGRSFYLQLLSESVAKLVLRKLNLPITNLIYTAGGHFYILAPAKMDETKLEECKLVVDKTLYAAHEGSLSLSLASVPVVGNDFLKGKDGVTNQKIAFAKVWENISEKLGREKRRKFALLMEKENIFEPMGVGGEAEACEVCGKELTNEEGKKDCKLCFSFAQTSQELRKAQFITWKTVEASGLSGKPKDWKEVLTALGSNVSLLSKIEKSQLASYCINSTEIEPEKGIIGFRFIGKHIPAANEQVQELSDVADKSEGGVKQWGVLRMDVDNLGKLFNYRLGNDATISRLATLSYFLNLFFSCHIEHIAKEESSQSVHLVYSGGTICF